MPTVLADPAPTPTPTPAADGDGPAATPQCGAAARLSACFAVMTTPAPHQP